VGEVVSVSSAWRKIACAYDYAENSQHDSPANILRFDVAVLLGKPALGAAEARDDDEADNGSEDCTEGEAVGLEEVSSTPFLGSIVKLTKR